MFRWRRILGLATGLALLAAGRLDAAMAADAVSLRLDFLPTGYHAPLFYGLAKGIYKDAGIDLTIADGKGSNPSLQAVAAGNDLIVLANLSTMLQSVGKGMPVVAIGGLIEKLPDSVFSLQGSGIEKPKDLEGHTIGIPPASAVFKLFPAFAAATGIDTSKVRIIQTDSSATLTAILNGQVDAATGWAFTDALKVASQKPINKPMLMADYGINVLGTGFVVRKDTLASRPDLLKRFMAATVQSYSAAATDSAAAVDALVTARPNLDRAVMLEQIKLMPAYFATERSKGHPFGWMSPEDWTQTYALLGQYFGMTETVDVASVYTNDFVPAK